MAAETVAEWLTRKELSTYAAAFEANGWDSLKQILALKEDEIERLVNDVKMLNCVHTLPLPQELRHGCRDDGMQAPQLRRPILFAAEREEKL